MSDSKENTFKGTQGYWFQSHRFCDNEGGYSTEVYCDKGKTIATLSWYPNTEVKGVTTTYREANAKLIASAPNLLEALQDCVSTIEWLVENGNVNQNLLETFCNISTNSLTISRDAINKALK